MVRIGLFLFVFLGLLHPISTHAKPSMPFKDMVQRVRAAQLYAKQPKPYSFGKHINGIYVSPYRGHHKDNLFFVRTTLIDSLLKSRGFRSDPSVNAAYKVRLMVDKSRPIFVVGGTIDGSVYLVAFRQNRYLVQKVRRRP